MSNRLIQIEAEKLQFSFLPSGDLYKISSRNILINQLLSNQIDGSLNNLYLRKHVGNGKISYTPLLGIHANSTMKVSENTIIWNGIFESVHYEVKFRLSQKGIWFWEINVSGSNALVDVIYGQDIGLANIHAVRSNEAYTSQYIDHSVYEDNKYGFVICSRQNQPQEGHFPYLQQGCFTKAVGYSTDGFQFFGLSYKETNQPKILNEESLQNGIYQYEFGYSALQSEKVNLNGSQSFVFYGVYKDSHPEAITGLEFENEIVEAWNEVIKTEEQPCHFEKQIQLSQKIKEPLPTLDLSTEEINKYFPNRILEEKDHHTLHSFFTNTYEHVVLKSKELSMERPHGHILMDGHNDHIRHDVLTTTTFMYGIFNSQIAIGNISMNKMMSNARNALNVLKTSGQRIYVEIDGAYHLLTMPSLYEMGLNYARWFYKTEEELFIITTFTSVDSKQIQLQLHTESGKSYRYLVTNQITMNNNEYEAPFHYEVEQNTISFKASSSSDSATTYPNLSYRIQVIGTEVSIGDEQWLAPNAEPESASLLVLSLAPTSNWKMMIQGDLFNQHQPFIEEDAQKEIGKYRDYYQTVMRNFHLNLPGEEPNSIQKFNAIAYWYTHNMLVHFSTPHGLEQYGGAAWGTRDVSQGPVEYFMATQNYETVRAIILEIYAHQYEGNGDWPQWFMFDEYTSIQQADSHGDIIVWPLKVVADYLEATHDYGLLEEQISYTARETFGFTEQKETLLHHIKKQLAYMKSHFLHDTYLPSYDDGDWDDTLQPANQQLKKYMISSWTVALTYQALSKLTNALCEANKEEAETTKTFARRMQEDFNHYIMSKDIIPGFIYMEDPNHIEFMLHPDDEKTGIHYRLLPMQRGVISELFSPQQAFEHYQLIKDKLSFPDGVRLMNRPAHYQGGVSTNFKRAEQASNFGREIGLQYVHAHIRFVEAMAKLGYSEETWHGLSVINPITIQDVVPNAEVRQSNAYFSSSDGKFQTRYEAQEHFDKLKDGSVPVKGGWRIYSSGPGIYMNQLISNTLGVRQVAGNLVLDPVLPKELDGLEFTFTFMGYHTTFVYHLNEQKQSVVINGVPANISFTTNPYRQGGFIIESDELNRLMKKKENTIEIFL